MTLLKVELSEAALQLLQGAARKVAFECAFLDAKSEAFKQVCDAVALSIIRDVVNGDIFSRGGHGG